MKHSSHLSASAHPSAAPRVVAHASQSGSHPGIAKGRKQYLTGAQRMKVARESLGWTIGRAATIYGVHPKTWSKQEAGKRKLDGEALAWIEGVAKDFRPSEAPPSGRAA
jgi:DNA-binding transcriptional regulator YiaG